MNANLLLRKTVQISAAIIAISILQDRLLQAQTNFVMNNTDAAGAASFNAGTNWTGGAAPSAGNTYQTGAFRIRTLSNITPSTFAGASLEISSGGNWRNKTAATVTVNNLIVANNGVVELSQPNGQNGATSVGTLAGNISLSGGTAVFMAGNSSDSNLHVFTISSNISGSGGLTTGNASLNLLGASPPTAQSNGTVILTGNNSFTGGAASNGLAGSKLQLGNANSVKNSTVNVGIANGLSFSQSIGTFNLGGLSGTQNITLTDTASTAVTLNVGGGINNNSSTYSGALSGAGGLTKSGTGTLTLGGANLYSGATNVTDGTLAITGSGSIANSSAINVASGANLSVTGVTSSIFQLGATQTLSGTGTLLASGKTFEAAGTISPGNSPGVFTQNGGTLALVGGGDFNFQVLDANGVAGVGYDTYSLTNGATLSLAGLSSLNKYNVNLWSLSSTGPDVNGNALNFDGLTNKSWTLFSTASAIAGFDSSFFAINTGSFNGTNGFLNNLNGGVFSVGLTDGGTDLSLNFTAVPEPSSIALFALAGIAGGLYRRSRTKRLRNES